MLLRPQDSDTEMETSVVKCIKEQDAGETYKVISRKWNQLRK